MFCLSIASAGGSFLKNRCDTKCTNQEEVSLVQGTSEATPHVHLHPLGPSELFAPFGGGKGEVAT